MQTKKKKYEIDMCNGPLVSKILLFAIPIALSGILQQVYNAADMMVIGRFAGSNDMAAIGSGSHCHLGCHIGRSDSYGNRSYFCKTLVNKDGYTGRDHRSGGSVHEYLFPCNDRDAGI